MTGYFLIVGWTTRALLLANGVNIKNLPIQADQDVGRQWREPNSESSIVAPVTFHEGLLTTRTTTSRKSLIWTLYNLSPAMVNYLYVNYFASGYTADWTIQTWNRGTGVWDCYQVIANWPIPGKDSKPEAGGLSDFKIQFYIRATAPES